MAAPTRARLDELAARCCAECGHSRQAHEHFHPRTYCSRCACAEFDDGQSLIELLELPLPSPTVVLTVLVAVAALLAGLRTSRGAR